MFHLLHEEKQEELLEKALKVGNVIKLYFTTTTPPKDKRIIIVNTEPLLGLFLINSTLTKFAINKPEILAANLKITESAVNFIAHDSYISCEKINFDISYRAAKQQLKGDFSRHLGQITEDLRNQIVEVVNIATTLSPIEKKTVIKNLTAIVY